MSMGRRRSRKRAGWPPNLYTSRHGYKYRHPVTRKDTWMGADRERAFAAARKLNAILIPDVDLVARVTDPSETVADAIRVFRTEDMPERGWAAKTADLYDNLLTRIQRHAGHRSLADIDVRDCVAIIREITDSPRARQQVRLALIWVLACAVEEGWIKTNPALQTRKANYTRQRERLTTDAYRAIHECAPEWLRNAMDISLLTLLRREDVVSLQFDDIRDGAIWVMPRKTESTTGARLRIIIEGDLDEVLARCRDDVLSPYVVHRLPGKARPTHMRADGRDHHTQVLPRQLTNAFAAARRAAGIDHDNPPTFHEIRSLGGALLRDAGWSVADVQALMAHSDAAMTHAYLEGHDAPWTDVRTGIALVR